MSLHTADRAAKSTPGPSRQLRPSRKWAFPGVVVGLLITVLGEIHQEPLFYLIGFSLMSVTLLAYLLVGVALGKGRLD